MLGRPKCLLVSPENSPSDSGTTTRRERDREKRSKTSAKWRSSRKTATIIIVNIINRHQICHKIIVAMQNTNQILKLRLNSQHQQRNRTQTHVQCLKSTLSVLRREACCSTRHGHCQCVAWCASLFLARP